MTNVVRFRKPGDALRHSYPGGRMPSVAPAPENPAVAFERLYARTKQRFEAVIAHLETALAHGFRLRDLTSDAAAGKCIQDNLATIERLLEVVRRETAKL